MDIDGVPAGDIAYQWQQSGDNGVNWSNIVGASSRAFTLQQAQVGLQLRATASYAGNQEVITGNATTAIVNVNDAGVAAITGTPVQGQILTAAVTDLDGLGTGTVSYRWQQLIGTTWSNISGATGQSWALQAAQVGRQVRVRATYTDRLLTSESNRTSAPTPVIVSSNIAGNDAGVVSLSGTPTQNQTLFANVTDVDGLPSGTSISYQWQQLESSVWTDIAGAAGRSLTLQQAQVGKQVRALASYSDALGGSEQRVNSASSTAIANVNDVGVPSLTGAPIRGGTLTAAVDDADGLPSSISYQWQQLIGTTWSSISGATGPSYVLQPAQVGRQVRVRASYTDLLGSSETNRVSGPTPVITNPNNNLGTISVTGAPTQKEALTAAVTDDDGLTGVTIGYQWQQSSNNGTTWTPISGATAPTLTLQQAQVNGVVRATATYVDTLGNAEIVTSNATATIANVNDLGTVAISGTPTQGQTLTANVTDVDGLTGVTIGYQWQRSGDGLRWGPISGATAQALTLQQAQVGERVRVYTFYVDALGSSEDVLRGCEVFGLKSEWSNGWSWCRRGSPVKI
jgi:hypothetical protein